MPSHKAWIYEIHKDKFIDNLMGSVEEIVNISKQYGIKLCVENTAFPDFCWFRSQMAENSTETGGSSCIIRWQIYYKVKPAILYFVLF